MLVYLSDDDLWSSSYLIVKNRLISWIIWERGESLTEEACEDDILFYEMLNANSLLVLQVILQAVFQQAPMISSFLTVRTRVYQSFLLNLRIDQTSPADDIDAVLLKNLSKEIACIVSLACWHNIKRIFVVFVNIITRQFFLRVTGLTKYKNDICTSWRSVAEQISSNRLASIRRRIDLLGFLHKLASVYDILPWLQIFFSRQGLYENSTIRL